MILAITASMKVRAAATDWHHSLAPELGAVEVVGRTWNPEAFEEVYGPPTSRNQESYLIILKSGATLVAVYHFSVN